MVRIWQINSPYHTTIIKSIPSSTVDTQITLAGKVALATEQFPVSNFHMILFPKMIISTYKGDKTEVGCNCVGIRRDHRSNSYHDMETGRDGHRNKPVGL